MSLYLLKAHLQTFLSIPINQKCQILSCDACRKWAICPSHVRNALFIFIVMTGSLAVHIILVFAPLQQPHKSSSSPSFQMYLIVPLPLLTSTKLLRDHYWIANLSLCLKQQEAIKTCGGTPPHILKPITGRKCVVSFKNRSLDTWHPLNKELSFFGYNLVPCVKINTLRTGDVDLRFYITTVQDGWRKSAFLTRACFPCTIDLIMQCIEPVSERSCWRMFVESWPHSELNFRHRASSI